MTTEEKARAYDEALSKCKAYIDDTEKRWSEEFSRATEEVFKEIFPELRESEDERIRKYLIEELKAAKSVGELKFIVPQPTREECISYLEKQKVNTEGDFGRGYDCGYEACLNSHGAEWFEKQKEQKEIFDIDKFFAGKDVNDFKKELFLVIRGARELKPTDEEIWLNVENQIAPNLITILQKEQKPVEWSEEDEKMCEHIISDLRGFRDCETDEELIADYEDEIQWLKSLSPSWKPSEEQMKALNAMNCCEELSYQGQQQLLIDLYQQLKKLM